MTRASDAYDLVDVSNRPTVAPHVAARAAAKVASEAHDADDAALLLQMLGLVDGMDADGKYRTTLPVIVAWNMRDAKGDTTRTTSRRT